MLKTSWSSEAESSTITTTSVWGLKYVPGRTSRSSSSTMFSAVSESGALTRECIYDRNRRRALLPEALELAKLALHLGLDVERLLALALAARVARDDQLADLCPQRRVRLS